MSTPVFDGLVGEVLRSVHVARERLATTRTGVDRLHAPDATDRCPTCREAWPCATRRLVDGTARGELDPAAAQALVDAALAGPAPEPERPRHVALPPMSEMLDTGRTGAALDLLLGGRPDDR